jgi:hypothetical protein
MQKYVCMQCARGTWRQVFICLRPPHLLGFCLGLESNFVGSESGQIHSACITHVYALRTTPPPPRYTFYTVTPGPSNLAKAEVDTGSLADVHDLPVRAQHEDESVQGLQQVRPQLLHM